MSFVGVLFALGFSCCFLRLNLVADGRHFGPKKCVECLSSFARFSQKVWDVSGGFVEFMKTHFSC